MRSLHAGRGNQLFSDRSMAAIARFGGGGLILFVLSFAPVGSEYRSLLLQATMPGAVMFLGIAAGLAIYGLARYRSRPMLYAVLLTVPVAAYCGFRVWQLAVTI